MILSLMAALSLSQTQPAVLDELRLISSQLALGMACEAAERTTVNFDDLGPYAMALIARGENEGLSREAINEAQELGGMGTMARLEQDYAEGRDSPNFSKLLEECDALNRELPGFFGPFTPED